MLRLYCHEIEAERAFLYCIYKCQSVKTCSVYAKNYKKIQEIPIEEKYILKYGPVNLPESDLLKRAERAEIKKQKESDARKRQDERKAKRAAKEKKKLEEEERKLEKLNEKKRKEKEREDRKAARQKRKEDRAKAKDSEPSAPASRLPHRRKRRTRPTSPEEVNPFFRRDDD
jgi:hypothetical protein